MKEKLVKMLGRSKTTVLAVVVAVVLVAAPAALAASGDPFILGKASNTVDKPTGLVSTLAKAAQSALIVNNKSGGSALDLRVSSGDVAPMKVNSSKRVLKLNADLLDDKSANEFAPDANKNGKADGADQADNATTAGTANFASDADTLDNKDSTAFGIRTDHAAVLAHNCDEPNEWNECAPVPVTVPSGKNYIVSVWSSFSAKMPNGTTTARTVDYCSAGKGPSIDPDNPCITPWGIQNAVQIDGGLTAASSSGDTISLNPGTYTFFTAIRPQDSQFETDTKGHVITKVLVRDETNKLNTP